MTANLCMLLLCVSLGHIRLVTSTKVTEDGVYIITMIADPDDRTNMNLLIDGHYAGFVAYAVEDVIAGLSVALYLKAGTRVSAKFTGDPEDASKYGVALASYTKLQLTFNSEGTLQSGTSFSFVYLEGNQRKYLNNYQHAVYTARTDRTGKLNPKETLSFAGRIATDYGWLYNPTYRTWTIPTAGSYIMSLRGDPDSSTLNVHLYKNSDMKHVFAWYNEGGTKSGQAGIFDFAAGDKLFMIDPNGRYVGNETFMSIALLWTESGFAFI